MLISPKRRRQITGASLALLLALSIGWAAMQGNKEPWRSSFEVNKANLADSGRSTYFILEPGYRLQLSHGKDTLIITVLDETKIVDGARTRIVEEKETKGGQLAEISRNYFAIDKATGDIYYLGEDVDIYENGKVTKHEGAWLSGVNGARFGMLIPGHPKARDMYYQEFAPKVAMDRAEVVSVAETIKVPAGTFKNCLHTKETSLLERGAEDKWYAPGVGLLKDGEFILEKIENNKP